MEESAGNASFCFIPPDNFPTGLAVKGSIRSSGEAASSAPPARRQSPEEVTIEMPCFGNRRIAVETEALAPCSDLILHGVDFMERIVPGNVELPSSGSINPQTTHRRGFAGAIRARPAQKSLLQRSQDSDDLRP